MDEITYPHRRSTTLQAALSGTPPTRSPSRFDQRLRKGIGALVNYFIPGIVEKSKGSYIYSVGLVHRVRFTKS